MSNNLSRRTLLAASSLGIASGVLGLDASANSVFQRRGKKPKNIIFLVSDGMSVSVPSMVDHYLQLEEGRSSMWRTLMVDPAVVSGLQDTRSLSSLVTDSAAASSSWGSGSHVWNGTINELPDGTKLRPLYDILGQKKMKRGLVSTATITHATPAGFAISTPSRDDEELIASLYLKSGVEVLLGGGDRFFSSKTRKDKTDLYSDFSKAGYTVVKDKSSLVSAKSGNGKLLGIFSKSHIPYFVDRNHDAKLANVPGLEEMARAAIDHLKGSSEGFILQIEAARVDHAAHSNDLAGTLFDQIEFDNTIKLVMDFARKDGQTLVIITSDHGNSNPGLNGAGNEYGDSTSGLRTLSRMKRSYEAMLPDFATGGMPGKEYNALETGDKIAPTVSNVQALLERDLGLKLKANEAEMIAAAISGQSVLKAVDQYGIPSGLLSAVLSNHTHVTWAGRQHTDDYTLISAFGPGAEAFAGLNQNISFFDKILATRGLKFSNPKMSFEEAQRAMSKAKVKALNTSVENHWI